MPVPGYVNIVVFVVFGKFFEVSQLLGHLYCSSGNQRR